MTLSVVVTIVEGGVALERCLDALARQEDPPRLEILVPWDDSLNGMEALARRHPAARFLAMGRVETGAPATSPGGQHELFDRRRAAGLRAATGDIIGILEDRGIPAHDWARQVMRLHAELPHAVIGGAVENGVDRLRNWAVYFCDFGRYAPPVPAGPARWVTDVNVSYKRHAITSTEPLWRERYHEPVVHDALAGRGETLFLSPALVTRQVRGRLSIGRMLGERFAWGRLFAWTRVRGAPLRRRLTWVAASPLIPLVVFARQLRLMWSKGRHRGRLVAAAPLMFVLLVWWSAGEAAGYLTGRP